MALTRLRPTPRTLMALLALLWAITFGALRDFVWADLRQGMISLVGLSRVTRGLVWLGFALLAAMIGALLFNDVWRQNSPLLSMLNSLPGRGSLLPVAVVPATLFMIAVAWAYLLAGALHGHWLIRLGVLLLYVLTAAGWTNSSTALNLSAMGYEVGAELRFFVIHVGVVALAPLFFLARWRARPRPAFEFSVLLILVAAMLLMAQARELENERTLGLSTLLPLLEVNVEVLQGLVFPLLLLIGLDIADFTRQAAGWATTAATERIPRVAALFVLAALFLWRLRDVAVETWERIATASAGPAWPGYLGALGVPVIIFAVWWLASRLGRRDDDAVLAEDEIAEHAESAAVPLILGYVALQLTVEVLVMLTLALPWQEVKLAVLGVTGFLNELIQPWWLLLFGAALVAGFWFAARGRRALGLYLATFGAFNLWIDLTSLGRPLEAFTWGGWEPVDFWWVVLLAGVALFWLARRELTTARAMRLLFLLFVTALLRQTNFIENPFSTLNQIGFAGVSFIAFGIIWDSVTAGSWANEETTVLPRVSRIFLYVGYVLLTVTVINWSVTAHDIFKINQFTGDAAVLGLDRFGRPLLYAIFVATLVLPAHVPFGRREVEESEVHGS